ncbi:MAG: hypothetical protein GXP31_18780 [Kiritimatiellaeota bacterium]|nr:hypothetical protein [Kiritimatiellota bacterium]
MLTIAISVLVAVVLTFLGQIFLHSVWWGLLAGTLGLFGVMIPVNLWSKKRLEALFGDVQHLLEETQATLKRKTVMLQNKMGGGGKGLQRQLEREQAASVRDALRILDGVKPLYKWSFLAERQANTLRAQLHYQLREYEQADRYFEKCLILDPVTLAMRMARQYKKGEWKALEKAFRRGVKRFKDEKATLLYAAYSWMLVKEQRIDDAIRVLDKGKDATENETLRTNWEHLVNGRTRRFSNAALGEQWFALLLEDPKPVKVRQRGRGRR